MSRDLVLETTAPSTSGIVLKVVLGDEGDTGWEGYSLTPNMLSTCKVGSDPQTSRKPGLIFWNWGVICFIWLEMLWQCVESGFCMKVGDWLGREGLYVPLMNGQCA